MEYLNWNLIIDSDKSKLRWISVSRIYVCWVRGLVRGGRVVAAGGGLRSGVLGHPTRYTRGQWGDGSQAANTHIAGVEISTILQDLNR